MDPILSSISSELLNLVEDQLSNSDSSSDEALCAHFIACGLTVAQACQAMTYRLRYARNIYVDGFTPIRYGDGDRRYNPFTRQIEPD